MFCPAGSVLFHIKMLICVKRAFTFRHCEERSDEAIQNAKHENDIYSRLLRFARNDEENASFLFCYDYIVILKFYVDFSAHILFKPY